MVRAERQQTQDSFSPSRLFPVLLILGAGILFYRTVAMISNNALDFLVGWVAFLLIVELMLDVMCIVGTIPWLATGSNQEASHPLRIGAACTVLHAVRVGIFVLGRLEPWKDFDVRPEYRYNHHERWNWFQVYFAGILSVLGLVGAAIIWRARHERAQLMIQKDHHRD